MDIFKIDKELKDNLYLISQKKTEINNLKIRHHKLLQEREIARFELVLDNIEIGQVIKLTKALNPLRYGDEIKIVRKNKKSVTVEILHNIECVYRINRVGTLKRVPALKFAETIFYCKEIRTMMERNEKLKMILC